MRALPPRACWQLAALALLFAGVARAQETGPAGRPRPLGIGLPPLPPAPAGRRPSTRLAEVRRVQATGEDTPNPPSASAPVGETGSGTTANETDLSIPRAEKEGEGGEPTEATKEAEEAAEPEKDPTKLLMNALGMEDSKIKIYGWLQNSYTGNTNGSPPSRINFGVNPNFLANSWQGNQYYLILEKPLEQNDTINFGARVDNLFGNDWQFNHMHGLFDTSFQTNHFAGYDPAQMYAEIHLPYITKGGIDIKGGRWYTLAGYEVVPATGRPLLSVPYMFNYGQPFTHFGMVSTWHATDKLNIYNGAINGWDRWIDRFYKWGYIGGFNYTFNDDKTTLTTILVWGPNQFPRFLPANTQIVPTGTTLPPFEAGRRNLGYGANDRTLFTTVLTHKWNDRLTQVIESDQAIEKNVPGLGPGGTNNDAEWYSFGNWFLYDFEKLCGTKDKLIGVWRSEVFRDNNGARTGFADNFYEFTLGCQIKPYPWLWFRPEARYDWAQFTKPYNDGTRGSQLTLAIDAILLY